MTETDSTRTCRLTLVGPSGNKAPKLLTLGPWTKPKWRRVVVELKVGSNDCPDWDHANRCVQAVQDLMKFHNGTINDHLLETLQTYMNVISFQTFKGPN